MLLRAREYDMTDDGLGKVSKALKEELNAMLANDGYGKPVTTLDERRTLLREIVLKVIDDKSEDEELLREKVIESMLDYSEELSKENFKKLFSLLGQHTDELYEKRFVPITAAFNNCQAILFNDSLKPKDEDQKVLNKLDKEYEGGVNYHKILKSFLAKMTKKKVPSQYFSFQHNDTVNQDATIPCQEQCPNEKECSLKFKIQIYSEERSECVWIVLNKYINDLEVICSIIESICTYMEKSEEQLENKFTF